jgi:hypothetical protein
MQYLTRIIGYFIFQMSFEHLNILCIVIFSFKCLYRKSSDTKTANDRAIPYTSKYNEPWKAKNDTYQQKHDTKIDLVGTKFREVI